MDISKLCKVNVILYNLQGKFGRLPGFENNILVYRSFLS